MAKLKLFPHGVLRQKNALYTNGSSCPQDESEYPSRRKIESCLEVLLTLLTVPSLCSLIPLKPSLWRCQMKVATSIFTAFCLVTILIFLISIYLCIRFLRSSLAFRDQQFSSSFEILNSWHCSSSWYTSWRILQFSTYISNLKVYLLYCTLFLKIHIWFKGT